MLRHTSVEEYSLGVMTLFKSSSVRSSAFVYRLQFISSANKYDPTPIRKDFSSRGLNSFHLMCGLTTDR